MSSVNKSMSSLSLSSCQYNESFLRSSASNKLKRIKLKFSWVCSISYRPTGCELGPQFWPLLCSCRAWPAGSFFGGWLCPILVQPALYLLVHHNVTNHCLTLGHHGVHHAHLSAMMDWNFQKSDPQKTLKLFLSCVLVTDKNTKEKVF